MFLTTENGVLFLGQASLLVQSCETCLWCRLLLTSVNYVVFLRKVCLKTTSTDYFMFCFDVSLSEVRTHCLHQNKDCRYGYWDNMYWILIFDGCQSTLHINIKWYLELCAWNFCSFAYLFVKLPGEIRFTCIHFLSSWFSALFWAAV